MRIYSGVLEPGIRVVAALLLLLLVGCGGDDTGSGGGAAAPPAAPQPTAAAETASAPVQGDAVAEAAEVFRTRCVTCHGVNGEGDGPGSGALTPAPRNFRNAEWQDEVSDDHIANIVMYGGAAVGRSPTMPGNPDLSGKPEVVAALVDYVRALRAD